MKFSLSLFSSAAVGFVTCDFGWVRAKPVARVVQIGARVVQFWGEKKKSKKWRTRTDKAGALDLVHCADNRTCRRLQSQEVFRRPLLNVSGRVE